MDLSNIFKQFSLKLCICEHILQSITILSGNNSDVNENAKKNIPFASIGNLVLSISDLKGPQGHENHVHLHDEWHKRNEMEKLHGENTGLREEVESLKRENELV